MQKYPDVEIAHAVKRDAPRRKIERRKKRENMKSDEFRKEGSLRIRAGRKIMIKKAGVLACCWISLFWVLDSLIRVIMQILKVQGEVERLKRETFADDCRYDDSSCYLSDCSSLKTLISIPGNVNIWRMQQTDPRRFDGNDLPSSHLSQLYLLLLLLLRLNNISVSSINHELLA